MLENRFSPTFRDSQMTTKNTVILAQILAHALDFASSIAGFSTVGHEMSQSHKI
jgi:hypothetical protein